MSSGYIYVLKEREFIRVNEPVYKVGCTEDIFKRTKQYPKGSQLLYCQAVNNCVEAERIALKLLLTLESKFKQRRDIGREYFECKLHDMIHTVTSVTQMFISDADIVTTPVDESKTSDDNDNTKPEPPKLTCVSFDTDVDKDVAIQTFIESFLMDKTNKCENVKSTELFQKFKDWCTCKKVKQKTTFRYFETAMFKLFNIKPKVISKMTSSNICTTLATRVFDLSILTSKTPNISHVQQKFISEAVTYAKNNVMQLGSFKDSYKTWCAKNRLEYCWSTCYDWITTKGYAIEQRNICCSCNKPALKGCCANYSPTNRVKKVVVCNAEIRE